ncbi:MAG: molybdate ABC transporter permease subunit [Desulfovibrio sp.]|nr:molybdate ABC transporter permease subunit [Desulfovibrio sp.]
MNGFFSSAGGWVGAIQSPLLISLKVALTATAGTFGLAILAAWRLRSRKSLLSSMLDAAFTLPLVLPPTVIGYYLIQLLGRRGLLGPELGAWGINLMFTWQGAVAAASVVIFPLIYKSCRAALEQVNPDLEDAARTLGASEWRILVTISIPLAWKGIFAGLILAFARGMGEFGATLMIAGNIPGKTQTLALAIYSAFQAGEDERAFFLAVATSVFCCAALISAEYISRLGRK